MTSILLLQLHVVDNLLELVAKTNFRLKKMNEKKWKEVSPPSSGHNEFVLPAAFCNQRSDSISSPKSGRSSSFVHVEQSLCNTQSSCTFYFFIANHVA